MSSLVKLQEIRLNKNDIKEKNIFGVIDSLTSIPHLESLHINLSQEEQVDYIIKKLPSL